MTHFLKKLILDALVKTC